MAMSLLTATPPLEGGGEHRGQLESSMMSEKQRYCLKWNNYQANVTTTFKELLAVEDFVDITLSAEGGALKAHKVVLSACSPYFRDILKGISSWQHPVIVLKDVPYEDLQGIVEFIYHGEVNVDKESLNSFLRTASTLRVKGLTEETAGSSIKPSTAATSTSSSTTGRIHSRKSSKPKRSLPFVSQANDHNTLIKKPYLEEENTVGTSGRPVDSNEEEIDDVEDEPEEVYEEDIGEEEEEEEVSPMQIPNPFLGLSPQSITNAALALAAQAQNPLKGNGVDLDEERKQRQQLLMGGGDIIDSDLFGSGFSYPPPLRNMLHMNGSTLAAATPDGIQSPQASSSNPVGSNLSQKKTCPYCGQQLSWHALSRHIRDMHKAKSNFVTCKFCNKMFRNKNSLGCHMWRFHKEAKEGAKDASIKAEPKIDNDIKPSSVEVENP